MIEQKIELSLITAISTALTAAGITDIQIIGAWQSAATNDIKAIEDDGKRGVVTVKVSPRSYASYECHEAEFATTIQLDLRTETDARGVDYLTITSAIADVLESYQLSFDTFAAALAISGEFTPTGFRLDGGDCGLNAAASTWTWAQNMTIQGII